MVVMVAMLLLPLLGGGAGGHGVVLGWCWGGDMGGDMGWGAASQDGDVGWGATVDDVSWCDMPPRPLPEFA